MQLAAKILQFLSQLQLSIPLPAEVEVMNPYRDPVAWKLCEEFYRKYYSDDHSRTIILGINPGRFGGGVTGIPFTDPRKLEEECGIPNSFRKKTELSADFIYKMINAFGGAEKFYRDFFICAVSPLGFTSGGKNLNYYDHPELQEKILPFVIDCLTKELAWGINRKVCYCLGEGKNFKFLSRLNEKHGFFEKIIALPHPRFIMQYRRKKIDEYIAGYLVNFNV